MKIKNNDNVIAIKGKDRNKKGKVVRVLPAVGRVIVGGINLIKKHQKPKRNGEKGKIVTMEAPINIANIALICPKCGAVARIGYKKMESGDKVRICRKCNQEI